MVALNPFLLFQVFSLTFFGVGDEKPRGGGLSEEDQRPNCCC